MNTEANDKWAGQRRIHLTVATIVTDGERFLLVEESPFGEQLLNQPAGHVEPGEDILAACGQLKSESIKQKKREQAVPVCSCKWFAHLPRRHQQ